MNNLQEAKQFMKELIKQYPIENKTYHGVLDINNVGFDFQEIAEQYGLSQPEYDELIEYSQELGDKKLNEGK